jgi:hypothetical protein
MARRKRDLGVLERLQRDFGDVPLSKAIAILKNPQPGQPGRSPKTEAELRDLYGGVEAYKAMGLGYKAACREYARFAKLSPKTVENQYAWAKRGLPLVSTERDLAELVETMHAKIPPRKPRQFNG